MNWLHLIDETLPVRKKMQLGALAWQSVRDDEVPRPESDFGPVIRQ